MNARSPRRYIADRHKAVYTEWVQAFGVVEVDKNEKEMPPQAISGRWENVEGSEARQSVSSVSSERVRGRPTNHGPHETIKSVNILCSTTCFKRPACNFF